MHVLRLGLLRSHIRFQPLIAEVTMPRPTTPTIRHSSFVIPLFLTTFHRPAKPTPNHPSHPTSNSFPSKPPAGLWDADKGIVNAAGGSKHFQPSFALSDLPGGECTMSHAARPPSTSGCRCTLNYCNFIPSTRCQILLIPYSIERHLRNLDTRYHLPEYAHTTTARIFNRIAHQAAP